MYSYEFCLWVGNFAEMPDGHVAPDGVPAQKQITNRTRIP